MTPALLVIANRIGLENKAVSIKDIFSSHERGEDVKIGKYRFTPTADFYQCRLGGFTIQLVTESIAILDGSYFIDMAELEDDEYSEKEFIKIIEDLVKSARAKT